MNPAEVEASCAICGAPPSPECPHESERLELAVNQAMDRWAGIQLIKDWVVQHARNQIILTFQQLKRARWEAHLAYLQRIPCYTLFQRYQGNPPLQAHQLALLHHQIQQANAIFKQGIDEDWRRSCMRYPEVLDYYFGLVDVGWPDERDPAVREPVFGMQQQKEQPKRVKARRDSVDPGPGEKARKKERKHRDRSPPPSVPMVGNYRR